MSWVRRGCRTSGPGGRRGEIVLHWVTAMELRLQSIHHDLDQDPDLATQRLLVVDILMGHRLPLVMNHVTAYTRLVEDDEDRREPTLPHVRLQEPQGIEWHVDRRLLTTSLS